MLHRQREGEDLRFQLHVLHQDGPQRQPNVARGAGQDLVDRNIAGIALVHLSISISTDTKKSRRIPSAGSLLLDFLFH